MKVLVIPDVHLKPWMFDRAAEIMRSGIAERAVCLMDIADSRGHEYDVGLYEETFDRAIAFQKQFPDTLWCLGNHDVSYIWGQPQSGFSPFAMRIVREKLRELQQALPDEGQMTFIHRIDDVLFLHAGLTDAFVETYVPARSLINTDAVIGVINELGAWEMWEETSPVWFRPQYYLMDMYMSDKLLQVVGHTPVTRICREDNVISCDVFSTYKDGTPVGTQEYLLIDTETWGFESVK